MCKRLVRRTRENWRAFNSEYLISDLGRWYSLKNQMIVKQQPNNAGYMRAQIWNNGKYKWYFTHITVVSIFGDCFGQKLPEGNLLLNGLSIDHKNFNKSDNSIFNLEIVSHRENCLRSCRHYSELAKAVDLGEIF